MNILDENILDSQRLLLRSWRVPVRQIGYELGRKGLADENILSLLLTLRRPTLFTRDLGFYVPASCHARYSLVCLAVGQLEVAHFIRRFLRHPHFATQAQRLGHAVHVMDTGLAVWRLHADHELLFLGCKLDPVWSSASTPKAQRSTRENYHPSRKRAQGTQGGILTSQNRKQNAGVSRQPRPGIVFSAP